MKLLTGIVVDGKVLVEGADLADGSTVTLLLRDDQEAFDLTAEEEQALLASLTQLSQGQYVSGQEMLETLRRLS